MMIPLLRGLRVLVSQNPEDRPEFVNLIPLLKKIINRNQSEVEEGANYADLRSRNELHFLRGE